MCVVNRGVGAPWSVWNDHQDSISQRDAGWIQIYAKDHQEIIDTVIKAYRLTEEVCIPVMVCYDGYYLSHTYMPFDVPEQEQVDAFLPPYEYRHQLGPENPTSLNTVTLPGRRPDLDGNLAWQMDLGKMQVKHGHGEGSSPALYGDTVAVNWDHEGESFLIALDKRTGERRWKVARDEITSWSSPLIVEVEGTPQVIVAATRRVRGYDLENGSLIWECGGLSGNVVATPVAAGGIVYVANSYDTRAMLAIRLAGAKGDLTGTEAVVWTRNRDTPYVPSPILYDGALCFLKHYQGLLTCVDANTGDTMVGPTRLPGIQNVYASPAGAAGRIYIVDRDGTTLVLRRGAELEPLARNRLDDSFSASPAIVGDQLILRGERYLYGIAVAPEGDRESPDGFTETPER